MDVVSSGVLNGTGAGKISGVGEVIDTVESRVVVVEVNTAVDSFAVVSPAVEARAIVETKPGVVECG